MLVAHYKRGLDIPYYLAENLPETLALPLSKLRSLSSLKNSTGFADTVPAENPCGRDSPTTSLRDVYPAAPCCTTSSAASLFAFEEARGRELGKGWTLTMPNPGTKYKGHTCTKGRGWNICRSANCLDCSTMSVQLGTHMYVPQHTWGEGGDREMWEEGEAGWLPQHLAPTLLSATPVCGRDAVSY